MITIDAEVMCAECELPHTIEDLRK